MESDTARGTATTDRLLHTTLALAEVVTSALDPAHTAVSSDDVHVQYNFVKI